MSKNRRDPKRVLIIDDDRGLARELAEALRLAGYEALACVSGASVRRKAPSFRPAAVLLDLKLVRESGFQIARELREKPGWQSIPIIAMTGHYTQQEHEALMKKCGIQACLIKPFSSEVAARKLEAFIRSADRAEQQ